ncbi:MAG: metallophosphoesterase family protein [Pseudolabrys sp.]|nr:metallophosphoesterase family protein [Pseudolabrys sp.]
MLTFAIGDIHGCFDQLSQLVDRCNQFEKSELRRFVFLGDYIDKGADSQPVVNFLMTLTKEDPSRFIALRGNHEDLLLQAGTNEGMPLWLINGGGATLRSFGVTSPRELQPEVLDWLRKLPLYNDDGKRFFVHAGIRPGVPLADQSREDLLWIREPFLSSTQQHFRLVIHGHSPTRDRKPDVRENRVNIDTGAFLGGPLTAAIFTDGETMPISFLQA